MDVTRYQRQMLLPDVGEDGQHRLAQGHAVLVGCGALGCVAADLLARAGVGRLTIIERDVVELTNLQRQTLFDQRHAAEALPKAEAARQRLAEINSDVCVVAVVADLSHENAERLTGLDGRSEPPALLIDATDNFETRLLLNDVAVKHAIPLAYAGVLGTRATQATFLPGGPCLRCLMPVAPAPGVMPTCDTAGVFAPAVSVVAACQASDAIKILLGRQDLVSRSLLSIDLWTNERRSIDLSVTGGCECCGQRRFTFLAGESAAIVERLCGQNATQVRPSGSTPLDMPALAARLGRIGRTTANKFLIRCAIAHERGDDGEPIELTVFADGRALVKGLADPAAAKSVYARYVGG